MNRNKSSRITSAALVIMSASMFAASANAGMPPSRQTPVIVPKDKQGIVEVGPCELPPCVGGIPCVPNARDYGYYESTWRQWPTQQRYDQHFPQALNANPVPKGSTGAPALEPAVISVPVPAPTEGGTSDVPSPMVDASGIIIQDDVEPVPEMGNYGNSNLVPSTTVVPHPVPQTDPLLDYSTNTVPGISTAPAVSAPPVSAPPVSAPPVSAPPVSAPPVSAPAVSAPPVLEEPPVQSTPPSLDSGETSELPIPSGAAPGIEEDSELTAPAPGNDSPLIESSDNSDETLTVPVSRDSSKEQSILVSQKQPAVVNNPYDLATDPYSAAAIQVSHEEQTAEVLNPFQTAVIPSEVSEAVPGVEQTVSESFQENVPAAESNSTSEVLGLEGFCPVTLLENEEWVEGNAQWTVMHHGMTYHLASAEQIQKFLSNPERYTPVMDGADPVLFAETGKKVMGNADNCVVYEGRLFMFTSEENLNKFFANTSAYVK